MTLEPLTISAAARYVEPRADSSYTGTAKSGQKDLKAIKYCNREHKDIVPASLYSMINEAVSSLDSLSTIF